MELATIQKNIDAFASKYKIKKDIKIRMIDLVAELGELSKEVLLGTDYGNVDFVPNKNWENELGDVFFCLICLANQTEVDLHKALDLALEKYEKRFEANATIASH